MAETLIVVSDKVDLLIRNQSSTPELVTIMGEDDDGGATAVNLSATEARSLAHFILAYVTPKGGWPS